MLKLLISLFLLLPCSSALAGDAKSDPVMRAMDKELKRSFSGLKKAEKVPLYYMAYEITVSKYGQISAKLGAIESDVRSPSAKLDVDMRVNAMDLDNTHQVKGAMAWTSHSGSHDFSVALDPDEDSIRARLWQYTDKTYKEAQERFTRVQMNKAVTAAEDDPSPDFSAAPVETFYEAAELSEPDAAAWRARVKKLSGKFKDYPFVYDSGVSLSWENENRYIANSEGTRIRTGNNYIVMSYSLMSRTTDGMDVSRNKQYHGDSFDDLPSDAEILADMDKSIKELAQLREAPIVEPYTGPAILNARAAGVYMHEIIGHRMEGHRQKLEDSGQTFAKKVGQKVTSDLISVYDDPSRRELNGTALRGFYRYDDEGVKGRRASLIENGVLKGFLMSRSPIRNFGASNGHGRRSSGNEVVSRMGNTIVEASTTVPYAELRRMLIEEAKRQNKPFGLVFDDISGGFTRINRGSGQTFKVLPLLVYRVYVDGRPDEIVRGVDIVGTPLTSFGKIAAAADDTDIFNGTCGAESGWVPVSAVSPSLLITEMEVEKSDKSQQKPPVLPPPLHGK